MSFSFLEYLLCEGYMPPTVAMLLSCVEVKYKGVAVGVFVFCYTIAGTIATTVDGALIKVFHG